MQTVNWCERNVLDGWTRKSVSYNLLNTYRASSAVGRGLGLIEASMLGIFFDVSVGRLIRPVLPSTEWSDWVTSLTLANILSRSRAQHKYYIPRSVGGPVTQYATLMCCVACRTVGYCSLCIFLGSTALASLLLKLVDMSRTRESSVYLAIKTVPRQALRSTYCLEIASPLPGSIMKHSLPCLEHCRHIGRTLSHLTLR